MRKRSFTKFLSFSLLLLFSFAVLPMQKVSAVDDPIVLDYIAINDFHGTVDDSASSSNPGIARIQTYLLGEKAKNPNTFFVSAGDQYQGSPISNLTYGEVVNDILAHMEMLTSADQVDFVVAHKDVMLAGEAFRKRLLSRQVPKNVRPAARG